MNKRNSWAVTALCKFPQNQDLLIVQINCQFCHLLLKICIHSLPNLTYIKFLLLKNDLILFER